MKICLTWLFMEVIIVELYFSIRRIKFQNVFELNFKELLNKVFKWALQN